MSGGVSCDSLISVTRPGGVWALEGNENGSGRVSCTAGEATLVGDATGIGWGQVAGKPVASSIGLFHWAGGACVRDDTGPSTGSFEGVGP